MAIQTLSIWHPCDGPFRLCAQAFGACVGALALLWDNGASHNMATESIPVDVPVDDESELVANARKGDTASFSTLLRRYEGKIFRLAMNITQNREDAEDVLQEAFLKAYEHLDQFQGNSRFYTWIVRIAVNQALMKLRKRRSDRAVSLDEQIDTGEDTVVREIAAWDPDPEQQFSQEELHRILTGAIDDLAPIYRTVFTLRDVDGLSTEETAEALELTVPAVKSRLLRARLQLRDKLTRFFKRKGDDAFAYM
jgi:RNA polymerase sigma-70 factor (ECF subfamily)